MRTLLSFFCLLLTVALAKGQEDWGYYESTNPPSTWRNRYPTCGMRRQSPIAINVLSVTRTAGPYLKWTNYDLVPTAMSIENNGETVTLRGTWKDAAATPYITADDSIFVLDNIHFHWGSVNYRGSEHTLNGVRYPMEMHAVHRKTQGPGEAILVVGIFYQVSLTNSYSPSLERLVNNFPQVRKAHSKIQDVKPFSVAGLLPGRFYRDYFYYKGSLTTPPCNETVQWIIGNGASGVTEQQLASFRSLINSEGHSMQDNFRPLQNLNGRPVYRAI